MIERTRKTTPKALPPDQEVLNIDGAAALLGVSVKTFSKVLREGDVPGRKVGREWKFSRQALIDWIGGARSRSFLEAGDDEEPESVVAPGAPSPAAAPRRRAVPRVKADDGYSVDAI